MTSKRNNFKWSWLAAFMTLASIFLLSMSSDTGRTLEFIPDCYDFGVIMEESGKAEGYVKAINISQDTTFISSVKTSCGCTDASHTEGLLAPGDTAIISFAYNPANRPGVFEKRIKVFTGTDRVRNNFAIKGKVKPSDESLRKAYPHEAGALLLSSTVIDAGKVREDELVPLFIGVYNPDGRDLSLIGGSDSPALEASFIPDTLPGHELGSLTMVLKARKLPPATKEFLQKAYIIYAQTSDTLVTIPVGGYLVP